MPPPVKYASLVLTHTKSERQCYVRRIRNQRIAAGKHTAPVYAGLHWPAPVQR